MLAFPLLASALSRCEALLDPRYRRRAWRTSPTPGKSAHVLQPKSFGDGTWPRITRPRYMPRRLYSGTPLLGAVHANRVSGGRSNALAIALKPPYAAAACTMVSIGAL